MVFWIAIAATTASVVISFVWTQKTLPIRLLLLVLALAGVGFTVDRHFADQEKQRQMQDEVADAKKLAGPRNFTGKDGDDIQAAAEPFRGTPYDLSLPPLRGPAYKQQMLELEPGSYFVNHLIPILASAGWELHSVDGDVPKILLPPGQAFLSLGLAELKPGTVIPRILVGQITGVIGVSISWPEKDERLMTAAYALAHVLNKAQIRADVDLPPPNNSIPADMLTSHAVHVVIGTKP